MTRFEQEISGALGTFWKGHAEQEATKMYEDVMKNAQVDADGAVHWISNGNYLMEDACEMLEYKGFDFSREATRVARDRQTSEFLKEYRARQRKPSVEEMTEMRSVFGEGAVVVDVFSGQRIAL